MESVCYSCGSHVADQAPFCSSCGAPQIRVPAREFAIEDIANALPAPASSTASPVAPPPMPFREDQPERIHWKSFLRLALPLAAVVGVSQAVYPALLLLLLPASVIVAIQLYRRRQPGRLRPAQGAKMGASIGLVSFTAYALLFAVKIFSDPAGFRQQMAALIQEAINRNPSTPEARQLAESLFGGTGGLVIFFAFGMGLLLMLLLVIGSVSGALAVRLFKEKAP